MIRVRRLGIPTLCLEIRKHVAPGTTIVTAEWGPYRRIPALEDADGTALGYVHLTGGAHTQNIETAWRPAKSLLDHPFWSAFALLGSAWFMVLVFRCFAVHTPSSNPHKKPPYKLKDTIKHPLNVFKD
ncbi:hypothetical protein ISCGN_003410 [Ixodes scapularis]